MLAYAVEFLENATVHLRETQLNIQMETALTLLTSDFSLKTVDPKPWILFHHTGHSRLYQAKGKMTKFFSFQNVKTHCHTFYF